MSMLGKSWGRAFALMIATASIAGADSTAVAPRTPTRIGGQFFGDYLYGASGSVQDSSAFQIRRVYLTADHDLSERITSRVTLEAENGTLAANGRLSPFLKLAYLEFKEVWPGANLFAGLAPTPLWQTTEAVWGYRSVEKTPLDFRGFGSSSDLGVAIQGHVEHLFTNPMSHQRAAPLDYHLMVANGSGQKPENDHAKKAYAALSLRPGHFILEPLYAYEDWYRASHTTTFKLLAAWQEERWAVGAEAWGVRRGTPDDANGYSAFARTRVGEHFAVFGRFDRYEPQSARFLLGELRPRIGNNIFVGLDYMPIPAVHVIPNLELEAFSRRASYADRESEAMIRLTLAYAYAE